MNRTPLHTNKHNPPPPKKKQIRHAPSHKQLEAKTKRTSFLCGNRNGHHNTKLGMFGHIIGQHKKKPNTMRNTDLTQKNWGALEG